MALHRRTHPKPVDGCFGCHVATLQLNGKDESSQAAMERRWQRDMPAFASLVAQGIMPKHIDGSADLVARSATKFEIESGMEFADKKQLNDAISIVEDATGKSVFEANTTPVKAAG